MRLASSSISNLVPAHQQTVQGTHLAAARFARPHSPVMNPFNSFALSCSDATSGDQGAAFSTPPRGTKRASQRRGDTSDGSKKRKKQTKGSSPKGAASKECGDTADSTEKKKAKGSSPKSQTVPKEYGPPPPGGLQEKLCTPGHPEWPLRLIIVGHNPSAQAWAKGARACPLSLLCSA